MQSASGSTKRKKLMVLGVGEAQLNLIRAAKEQGYFVIACDVRGEMEGAKLADQFLQVDYLDREAILRIAREERIDGIASNAEAAMLNVAYVSERMGLPGNSVESVEQLVSKQKFRELQKKVGVFAPEHFVVGTVDELIARAKNIRYPIIVKPEESSGTRGTTKILEYDEKALAEAFNVCVEFSRNRQVSIEEYIEMQSLVVFDADIFVLPDEILFDGIFSNCRSEKLPLVPMTKIFPSVMEWGALEQIKDTTRKILNGSGIKLGEYNVEAYISKDGQVFVIEINARQGGEHIPQLVYEHSSVDFTKLLVTTAVGDTGYCSELKNFERTNHYITAHTVFPRRDGRFEGVCIHQDVQQYVNWREQKVLPGSYVKRAQNASDVLEYVVLQFESREEQLKYSLNMERYIFPIIKDIGE